jgi:tripartite-type tricarboxylate transporter receptor subunit TctC
MTQWRSLLAAALLGLAIGIPATDAGAYPDRSVRVIVPFPAGGGTDIVGRVIAEKLSDLLGKQFVVENRPGAGAMLGADQVAKAAPDGHTILVGTSAELTISPALFANVPYKPATDFIPIALLGVSPVILLANPKFPANDLRETIARYKAAPDKVTLASGGMGAAPHLAAELFKSLAANGIVIVPYKGAADSLRDLIGGQVDLSFSTIASALPHINAKAIKPIAVMQPKRSALLPDVPSSAEQGLPELQAVTWFGLFAPAATPKDVVDTLRTAVGKALQERALQERFEKLAVEIGSVQDGGDVLQKRIAAELERWKRVVREANIPVQ